MRSNFFKKVATKVITKVATIEKFILYGEIGPLTNEKVKEPLMYVVSILTRSELVFKNPTAC